MAVRESKKIQFVGGIIAILCGILIVVVRLDGWARFGEKLQLGAAATLFSVGAVLISVSHRRKGDK